MKSWLPVFTAVIVGILGILGQFFISRRNHIVSVRDERAKAYGDFMSAALLGIRSVVNARQVSEAIRAGTLAGSTDDHRQLMQRNLDAADLYEIKISDSLSFLHLFAPKAIRDLGNVFNKAISSYQLREISEDELNSAYSSLAIKANNDLESLRVQSQGFLAFFRSSFNELDS